MWEVFGKHRFTRLALVALALAITLGIWPYGGTYYPRRDFRGLLEPAPNNDSAHGLEQSSGPLKISPFPSPPILYRTSTGELHAWDWRDNRLWRIPIPRNAMLFAPARRGKSVAFLDVDEDLWAFSHVIPFHSISVIDIAPPHTVQTYPLPGAEFSMEQSFLAVVCDDRFAIFGGTDGSTHTINLTTGKYLMSQPIAHDGFVVLAETEEFEQRISPWRLPESTNEEIERWRVDPTGALLPAEPRHRHAVPEAIVRLESGMWRNTPPMIVSRDGQWAVIPSEPTSLAVFRAAVEDQQATIELKAPLEEMECFLSAAGGELIAFHKTNGDITVWEVATGKLVAANTRSRSVAWLHGLILCLSLAGVIVAIGLFARSNDLTLSYVDFGLTLIFSSLIFYAVNPLTGQMVVLPAAFSCAVLVGIYWALAHPPLGYRIATGALVLGGIALVAVARFHSQAMLAESAGQSIHRAESTLAVVAMHIVAAISAFLATLPMRHFDLRIGRTPVQARTRGFQFDLVTIMTITAMLGAWIASYRAIADNHISDRLVNAGDVVSAIVVASIGVALLGTWLGMLTATTENIGCASMPVGLLGLLAILGLRERFLLGACAIVGLVTPFVAAFALARLAGYRWVRTIPADEKQ